LQAFDDVDLVSGQHLGDDLVDADLVRDGPGHGGVVAGEQYRSQAEAAQRGDGVAAGGLDGVGDGEDTACGAVAAGHDGGLPGGLSGRSRACDLGRYAEAGLLQQCRAAGVHVMPVDHAADAEPVGAGEAGHRRQLADGVGGAAGDGLRDRVFGCDLDRAGQAQ
jgi:hypothetical protein